MARRLVFAVAVLAGMCAVPAAQQSAEAAGPGQPSDWQRFYYYPYVYYPQNFNPGPQTYDHMYYRYPAERRIPVYNENWHNFYPKDRPYHKGHHFILDVF